MKKIIIAMFMALALPMMAHANMSCFQTPESDEKFGTIGGFNKQEERKSMYEEKKDPAMQLMACAMGGINMKDNCQCKQDIKELCTYKIKKGKIKKKVSGGAEMAWCNVFPLSYWGRG